MCSRSDSVASERDRLQRAGREVLMFVPFVDGPDTVSQISRTSLSRSSPRYAAESRAQTRTSTGVEVKWRVTISPGPAFRNDPLRPAAMYSLDSHGAGPRNCF